MDDWETVLVKQLDGSIEITFNRPVQKNSINIQFLEELNEILDLAEKDERCRAIVLQGNANVFCAGMDLHEIGAVIRDKKKVLLWATQYSSLLKRLTAIPKLIISKVEGKAFAGGLGLVAASDLVYASDKAEFKLTEAMWGLLPAIIAPYIIRRVGFQKTYMMALTCQLVPASEALAMHLVDEVSANLDQKIEERIKQHAAIDGETVSELKNYFRNMWIINDEMEAHGVGKTIQLLQKPEVQKRIDRFIQEEKLPWE
jgi:polyketide biosynthesis enoyl-CoA hydratase PksH